MYNEIKSCVTVNGCNHKRLLVHVLQVSTGEGVRQVENLSPLLFSIYLNDLDNFMHTSGCKGIEINIQDQEFIIFFFILFVFLYTDDSLVLSDNPKDFQDMLYIFNDYCSKWKLKINTDKTKAMIFGDYARNRPVSFNIAGDEIETIKEFKYLGVLFTKNGRFVQHI